MAHIKTIAIVGAAGNMGSAIARSLQGKYRLLLMSRDESKLVHLKADLASAPGAEVYTMSCAKDAAWEADIIIIATPYGAEREVAEKIRDVAVGKIVISISNPNDGSYGQPAPSGDSSAAEVLQGLLPYSKVVKTFNTMFASDFMTSRMDGKVVDAFIAGNNSDAVESVSKVVVSAGFSPIVVGDLSMSRMLERMQSILVRMAGKHNPQPVR
jgi:predicted dinucleotide-binding enzyme